MSVPYNTEIIISGHSPYKGPIGKFIDNLLHKNKKDIIKLKKDSVVLYLTDKYKIVGVSDKEKIGWKQILQVSRHPANGRLVKVYTRSGKTTTATLSHSFLKRTTTGITTIKGSELKVGDRIPVAKYIPTIKTPKEYVTIGDLKVELDKEFGKYIGAYLAEGSINGNCIAITNLHKSFEDNCKKIAKKVNKKYRIREYRGEYGPAKTIYINCKDLANFIKDNFGKGSYNKRIPEFVYTSNLDFIKGMLIKYFDGNGNVNASTNRQSIRCGSRSEQLIQGICQLLAYCGIFANKLQEKHKPHPNKVLHTLSISKKYAQQFKENIGTDIEYKLNDLNKIIDHNNRKYKHAVLDRIDRIPELGDTIATIGKLLKLPGRLYGRWKKKNEIGRRTLQKYIKIFEEENNKIKDKKISEKIQSKIDILKQAVNSDVVWDKIVKLEYLDDPKEYVYDFTVPGNDSFMVDCGILVHNTLNTFHHAGTGARGTATLGVPRINELISFSTKMKTPMMTIYANKKYRKDKNMVERIASSIKNTTILDIRNDVNVYYDPMPRRKGGFMDKDNVYNIYHSSTLTKRSCQSDINTLPWLARVELNREMMLDKNITLLDIKSMFCEQWENRYANLRGMKKDKKKLLDRISQCAILSNNDNDKVPIIHIRIDMINFDYETIVGFVDMFVDEFKLKGISGIEKISGVVEEQLLSDDNETKKMVEDKQFVIYTAGINLTDVRYLNGIDINRTICNDVVEIYRKFGVEALRSMLLKEFKEVFSGHFINYQHLSVLVDIMINNGGMISVDRHGMNEIDKDPLAKASFEKPVDQLIQAAIYGETDNMQSVSSRIMAGLVIKGGTGLCDIGLDTEMLEKSEYIEDIEHKYHKTFNEIFENTIQSDILKKEHIEAFIPI
jgi:hypothetical protein